MILLVAEDDADQRLFLEEAFEDYPIAEQVIFVEDGVAVMHYLQQEGAFADSNLPKPDLILLDLNMPKKDGRETLKELKQHNDLKHIPVVAFTVSQNPEDIMYAYKTGAAGYINKPISFQGLIEVLKNLETYWKKTVVLPRPFLT